MILHKPRLPWLACRSDRRKAGNLPSEPQAQPQLAESGAASGLQSREREPERGRSDRAPLYRLRGCSRGPSEVGRHRTADTGRPAPGRPGPVWTGMRPISSGAWWPRRRSRWPARAAATAPAAPGRITTGSAVDARSGGSRRTARMEPVHDRFDADGPGHVHGRVRPSRPRSAGLVRDAWSTLEFVVVGERGRIRGQCRPASASSKAGSPKIPWEQGADGYGLAGRTWTGRSWDAVDARPGAASERPAGAGV